MSRRLIACLLMLAAVASGSALAQQPKDAVPLPAVPPPPPGMEAFDAALEPQVTIVQSEKETREEFRINGRLYMVKVTPAAGKPYYLIDRQGNGQFVEAEVGGPPVKPPMWLLHSW